jgi:hypothetical protein
VPERWPGPDTPPPRPVESLERRQVAVFNNQEFCRRDQMLRQEVVKDPGVVVGRVVRPHKGRTQGSFAHLIVIHFLPPA